MVVADGARMGSSTPQKVGEETFVSWGIRNVGDVTLDEWYFVDLYFDDVVINRWTGISLVAGELAALIDWSNLSANIAPTPGVHVLKLVLDSTNLVAESDETDNSYELEVVWESGDPAPSLERPVTRLPTLPSPSCEGCRMSWWQARTPMMSRTGRSLSICRRTSFPPLRIAASPASPIPCGWTSTTTVSSSRGGRATGRLPEPHRAGVTWSGIGGFVPVTPGEHILKVVVDPTDLVVESDETNNAFEKVFTWDTGPVPAKPAVTAGTAPVLPQPLASANLQPGWTFDSDGPISLFHEGDAANNPPLIVGQDVLLRVAVKNRSGVGTRISFSVDVFFDDKLVNTIVFRAGIPQKAILGLAMGRTLRRGGHSARRAHDQDRYRLARLGPGGRRGRQRIREHVHLAARTSAGARPRRVLDGEDRGAPDRTPRTRRFQRNCRVA